MPSMERSQKHDEDYFLGDMTEAMLQTRIPETMRAEDRHVT
jgi:hypothetical protein